MASPHPSGALPQVLCPFRRVLSSPTLEEGTSERSPLPRSLPAPQGTGQAAAAAPGPTMECGLCCLRAALPGKGHRAPLPRAPQELPHSRHSRHRSPLPPPEGTFPHLSGKPISPAACSAVPLSCVYHRISEPLEPACLRSKVRNTFLACFLSASPFSGG